MRQMQSIWRVAVPMAVILLQACFADAETRLGMGRSTMSGGSTSAGMDGDSTSAGSAGPGRAETTAAEGDDTRDPGTFGATAGTSTATNPDSDPDRGSSTAAGVVCGDDVAEDTEACDGIDLGDETCVTRGFDAGSLACAADCGGYDVSGCITHAGDCCAADGTPGCDDAACTAAVCAAQENCCDAEWDEECAAAAMVNPFCQEVGGSCPACGDEVAEGLEVCDGTAFAGEDCISQGFGGGTLVCAADCSGLDTSECNDGDCCAENPTPGCNDVACTNAICETLPSCCSTSWHAFCALYATYDDACDGVDDSCPDCGDGTAELVAEICDGSDLADESCESQGFTGGILSCEENCEAFDTTFCLAYSGDCCAAHDGQGCDDWACVVEICTADTTCCFDTWDEDCANLAMEEPWCQGIGSCPGTTQCGDGVAQGDEVCDGTDFNGLDCADVGYREGGALACAADCASLVTDGCTPHEGDCCMDNDSPGCDDPACAAAVCETLAPCCIIPWGANCPDIAMNEPACQGVDSCPG